MKIIRDINKMQRLSRSLRKRNITIGFVPTMGALHPGHLKLLNEAKKASDFVVVSIFINPMQFGPKEDFKKYPRNFKKDKSILKTAGADVIFYPSTSQIYPEDFNTYVEVRDLGNRLCGISRPEHFVGVATIVAKLLNIVMPDIVFFGAKDFQQQVIIKKMIRDLNLDVAVKTFATIREKDGLAMSSRNSYLSKEERAIAPVLFRSLLLAKSLVKNGEKDPKKIISRVVTFLSKSSKLRIDYVSVIDPETLDPISKINKPVLIAVAARLGKTRLIDNIIAKPR